jgi:DNA-binding response OmpR family regulator
MNSSKDVLEGFELGANDYLKKPFEMIELKARIDNIKRHFKIDEENIISITDSISYNPSKYTLYFDKKEHKLPKKEGEFLSYFLNNRDKVISTDELMVNVWSYDTSPTSSTIRTYIKNLRRLLGEDIIVTIRGVGYLFS